jgi:acetoin utilization deacetylase AcuC-like enzyme
VVVSIGPFSPAPRVGSTKQKRGSGIGSIHRETYVNALRTGEPEDLATGQGFAWDPGIWEMARYSTAGVIAATDAALIEGTAGSLSSGLHHAKPDGGDGFCTVNGIAIAAISYLSRHPDLRVTILDLDAHCGGGTVRCLEAAGLSGWVRHLDLSTSAFDTYEPSVPGNRLIVLSRANDDKYLSSVKDLLDEIDWEKNRSAPL